MSGNDLDYKQLYFEIDARDESVFVCAEAAGKCGQRAARAMVTNRCKGLREAGCFLANPAVMVSPKTFTFSMFPFLGTFVK